MSTLYSIHTNNEPSQHHADPLLSYRELPLLCNKMDVNALPALVMYVVRCRLPSTTSITLTPPLLRALSHLHTNTSAIHLPAFNPPSMTPSIPSPLSATHLTSSSSSSPTAPLQANSLCKDKTAYIAATPLFDNTRIYISTRFPPLHGIVKATLSWRVSEGVASAQGESTRCERKGTYTMYSSRYA